MRSPRFASRALARLLIALALAAGCGGSSTSTSTTTGAGGSTSASTTTGAGGAGGAGGTSTTTGVGGAGGSGGGGVPCVPTKTATFSGDVMPILQASCSGVEGCHHILFKTTASARAFLVGTPTAECPDGRLRVDPGHPEASFLMDKLKNEDLCGTDPMPKNALASGFTPLPDDQIQAFSDWICAGALDD